MKQDWKEVYVDEPDKAYSAFLATLTELYEINCLLKKSRGKQKYVDKPWITKGLQNACKKKNTLYREYLNCKTKENGNKYKRYKHYEMLQEGVL